TTTSTSATANRPTRARCTAADERPQAGVRRAAPNELGAIMPAMATDTDSRVVPTPDRSPSSWGLGDGQAVPWEYAPAPEAHDIVTLQERYGLFITGREVAASDGGTFPTVNPATEETLALVARA